VNLLSSKEFTYSLAKTVPSTSGFNLETFQYLCTFDWSHAAPEDKSLDKKLPLLKQFVEEVTREANLLKQKEVTYLHFVPYIPLDESRD